MDFQLLGPFQVLDDEGRRLELGGHKQRAVLATLALNVNRVVSLDRLIDELWGDQAPPQAIGTLQAYVSNLRRVLEAGRPARKAPGVLVTQRPGYVLKIDPMQLDSVRFEEAAAEGRQMVEEGRLREGRQKLAGALALWRGPALADFAFESFAQVEANRLEELRLLTLEDRLQADLDLGAHNAAVAELEALVSAHPTRERLTGLLMVGLYRSGRQADALAAYQRARATLVEELGIDPGPSLRGLEADILDQVESLEWQPADRRPARTAHAAPAQEPVVSDRKPLVGRTAELARLEEALRRATGRSGSAVLIQGEPGIGKTRLVEELLASAQASGIPASWGGGVEGGVTPAYWPWVSVVRTLISGLRPEAVIAMMGPGLVEVARVIPEVKELVGQPDSPAALDPETARLRLFEALAGLLTTSARRAGGLVVVLDDLQWADVASLQLLSFLGPRLKDSALLILGTYRPAEVGPDHPLSDTLSVLARHRAVDRIELTGLGEAEVGELIASTTGAAADSDLAARVRARTEGNPFFVAELAQLLASEHGLENDSLSRAIPAGVRDVVRRRLARLPEQTTALLGLAAVAGRDFELEVLDRAADLDSERTLELVEAALMSGLVMEHSQNIGSFRFSHDLTRETILEGLTGARRSRLHARIAVALLALHGDDPSRAQELAYHFFHAAPTGLAGKAITYAFRAAEVATARLAYEQAEQQIRRALELINRLPVGAERDRTELTGLVRLNSHLMMTRGYAAPEAGEALERALDLALKLGDTPDIVPVLWGLMAFNFVGGRYRVARRYADRLLEVAEETRRPADLVAAHHAVGGTATHQEQFQVAVDHLETALKIPEGLNDASLRAWLPQHPVVACSTFLAFSLWELGDKERARRMVRDTVRFAETVGHDLSVAHALDFVAFIATLDRDIPLVRSSGEEAAEFARQKRFPLYVALNSILAGWARGMEGRIEEGIADMLDGMRGMEATGARMLKTLFLSLLAEVQLLAGRAEEALESLDKGLELVELNGEGFWEAELHRNRGELLLAEWPDRIDEATEELQTALETARRQGSSSLEERALASLERLGRVRSSAS